MPGLSLKNPQPLSAVAKQIRDGDLLLFRGAGTISRWIKKASRGRHSHAALAIWCCGVLMCGEVRELRGGRLVTLASQVELFPGRIDVFSANAGDRWPAFNPDATVHGMIGLAGSRYGWSCIWRSLGMRLGLIWAEVDDTAIIDGPLHCSGSVSLVTRLFGGVDPVPQLSDGDVEPGDLARSPFYSYQFTLETG